jgi:hypothetical protein
MRALPLIQMIAPDEARASSEIGPPEPSSCSATPLVPHCGTSCAIDGDAMAKAAAMGRLRKSFFIRGILDAPGLASPSRVFTPDTESCAVTAERVETMTRRCLGLSNQSNRLVR